MLRSLLPALPTLPFRRHPVAQAARPVVAKPPALDLQTLLGPDAWGRLPVAVQRRFSMDCAQARYDGHIDLKPSWIGRCFALCARLLGAPLCGEHALNVPTAVRVYHNADGGMVWERAFNSANNAKDAHYVRSTKQSGPLGGVVERTEGGLSMDLHVFEDHGALVFESRRFLFCVGQYSVRIPALLTPGQCRVEHRDLGAGLFRFSLDMVHPVWGKTFHQSGVFVDPHWSAA